VDRDGRLKLRLAYVAKGRTAWADEAARDYTKRLKRYAPFEEWQLRPGREGALPGRLGPSDRLVVLDPSGTALSSEGWAGLVDGARNDGVGQLVVAIGGASGHLPEVKARAWRTVRLGPCVLNHQVARVVVLEQLYRAWTIVNGEPYHRA